MLVFLASTTLPAHYQAFDDSPYLHLHPSSLPSPFQPSTPSTTPMQRAARIPPHPTVRVHRSTPSPGQQSSTTEQSMLAQNAFLGSGWGHENYSTRIPHKQYHKRASSGSSVASAGPPSPLNQTTTFPHIATSDSSTYSPSAYDFDYMSTPPAGHTSKPLPTPQDTPLSATFMAGGYHNVAPHDAHAYTSAGMRRIQSSGADDDYGFSGQSVSSMSHNSPATPHTNYEVDFDDSKNIYHGYHPSAAYSQAMQDVFPDHIYPAATSSFPQHPQQNMQRFSHLPPHRTILANRLQVANQDHLSARTNSPVTSVPRDRSPFRQNSPFVEQMQMSQRSPQPMNRMQPQQQESKSVSPKELMLEDPELDDDDATPLFPPPSGSIFPSRRESSTLSNFQFTPGFAQSPSVQIPQQYPFVSPRSRQDNLSSNNSNNVRSNPEQTPDFPAHIASMESTVEEGPSEPSSQHVVQRPEDTSSDAGTYTCTYHGCTQRFETPSKLQKHKREAHRQPSPTSAPSQSTLLRNSQAGPHKCERINPSTNKACNSIFSRPYDLTRHEDTIHNARKQKVRCHLCTEEKTFSRNDALTRHMRVVHPDVDWPGKTKRKNGRD